MPVNIVSYICFVVVEKGDQREAPLQTTLQVNLRQLFRQFPDDSPCKLKMTLQTNLQVNLRQLSRQLTLKANLRQIPRHLTLKVNLRQLYFCHFLNLFLGVSWLVAWASLHLAGWPITNTSRISRGRPLASRGWPARRDDRNQDICCKDPISSNKKCPNSFKMHLSLKNL